MKLPQDHKVLNKELYDWIDEQIAAIKPLNLLFIGKAGTGKTELANIIYDNYLEAIQEEYKDYLAECEQKNKDRRGKTYFANGINYNVPRIIPKPPKKSRKVNALEAGQKYQKILMSSFGDEKVASLTEMENLLNCHLTVLDDIGTEHNEKAKLYIANLLLNHYNYSKENWTSCIITGNQGADEIRECYGSRVIDRLYERFNIVTFDNPSFRYKKAKQHKVWTIK